MTSEHSRVEVSQCRECPFFKGRAFMHCYHPVAMEATGTNAPVMMDKWNQVGENRPKWCPLVESPVEIVAK